MLTYLLVLLSYFTSIDFARIFGEDYQKAVDYCIEHKDEIKAKAALYQLPANQLSAIVFPELIRYSTFQNFFETKALEYIYINQGSKVADFSIGHFQMKPSFVERLEETLIKNDALKEQFEHLLLSNTYTITQQRALRLERLQELSWQLDYLCCFYVIVQQEFKDELSTLNTKEQLKFIATAYNTGFYKSYSSIKSAMKRATYPYGSKYPKDQQYIYAEVALDYYQ